MTTIELAKKAYDEGRLIEAEQLALAVKEPSRITEQIVGRMTQIRFWNTEGKPIEGVNARPFEDFPKYARALQLIKSHTERPASLLDVGTYTGVFPLTMRNHGYRAFGCDYQKALMREMYIHFGGFFYANAERLEEEFGRMFDAVTMFDLLEHVIDDKTAIESAKNVLKPQGLLIVHVPRNDLYPDASHEHMRIYTKDDVSKLIPGANIEECTDEDGRPTILAWRKYD